MAKKEKKDHHSQPIDIEIEFLPSGISIAQKADDKEYDKALLNLFKGIVDRKKLAAIRKFLKKGERSQHASDLGDLGELSKQLWCG
jgi:hypothetical protein